MLEIKPVFYDDFKCIAGECTDSCCVGWEIDVDENTLGKYNEWDSDFANKIRENLIVDENGAASFKLCESERCPFLNEKNLCDIIINYGEESLCDICREHPRFYNEFYDVVECGLGLCCEEATRLLLSCEKPFDFIICPEDSLLPLNEGVLKEYAEDDYISFYYLRKEMFDILNKSGAFEEKIRKIAGLIKQKNKGKVTFFSDEELFEKYEKTEPINEEWKEYFNDLKNDYKNYIEKESPFDEATNGDEVYSKILSYIIFRHLGNSLYEDTAELCEYFGFCVSGVRFIKLCDMKTYYDKKVLTLTERIENIKRWSKQIEYSDENIELIFSIKRYLQRKEVNQ